MRNTVGKPPKDVKFNRSPRTITNKTNRNMSITILMSPKGSDRMEKYTDRCVTLICAGGLLLAAAS